MSGEEPALRGWRDPIEHWRDRNGSVTRSAYVSRREQSTLRKAMVGIFLLLKGGALSTAQASDHFDGRHFHNRGGVPEPTVAEEAKVAWELRDQEEELARPFRDEGRCGPAGARDAWGPGALVWSRGRSHSDAESEHHDRPGPVRLHRSTTVFDPNRDKSWTEHRYPSQNRSHPHQPQPLRSFGPSIYSGGHRSADEATHRQLLVGLGVGAPLEERGHIAVPRARLERLRHSEGTRR